MNRTYLTRNRPAEDKAASVADYRNARRAAEYVARRNGQKPALLQLFQVVRTAL